MNSKSCMVVQRQECYVMNALCGIFSAVELIPSFLEVSAFLIN